MRRSIAAASMSVGVAFGMGCFALLAGEQSAFAQSAGPVMTFAQPTVDWGTVPKGGDRVRSVRFTNTGIEPLIVKGVSTSCGCVVAAFPKEPIMPGESGGIDLSYDTQKVGAFTETVTFATNESIGWRTLTLTGTVLPE